MKSKIRWGILGCGRIDQKFAADLAFVKDAELIAVGSRDMAKAKQFAGPFAIRHVHGSYEGLVMNQEVDVIYIATPHSFHYENTILCLQHNKAVLCEKPFAINSRQAREMIQMAKEKGVFLMEALWTKFLPHYQKAQELVKDNKLGEIKSVIANFGFRLNADAPKRLSDPALGGGTLLDIGVYNVFMALSFLGKPDKIEATMSPTSLGVDEQCSIVFTYKNGAIAQLFSSFITNTSTEVEIHGTEARLKIASRFYEPSSVLELRTNVKDKGVVVKVKKDKGIGYHHEARHVNECLKKGLTESPVVTHADTLLLMEILDEIRKVAGIKYAADQF
jgi:predicted dehydrogenase